jgi:hypothetical protein
MPPTARTLISVGDSKTEAASSQARAAVDMMLSNPEAMLEDLKVRLADAQTRKQVAEADIKKISVAIQGVQQRTIRVDNASLLYKPLKINPQGFSGPTTTRGTPRQRACNVLQPAVEQVIASMDDITSPAIYECLKASKFKFQALTKKQAIASISSILRKKRDETTLAVLRPGFGRVATIFRKIGT